MIENRAKIEKQIFLGRQAVRRSLRTKTGRVALPEAQSMLLQNVTPHNNNRKLEAHLPLISGSPPPSGSDHPLSVDTDAEVAFANGARWFFQRGHATASPSTNSGATTPLYHGATADPLRSPGIRRKWANDLLNPSNEQNLRRAETRDAAAPSSLPITNQYNNKVASTGFFAKFRTKSFPSLPSPFSQEHRRSDLGRDSTLDAELEPGWSSDSSSEDDLIVDDRRRSYHSLHYASLDPIDGEVGEVDDDEDH